MQLYDCKTAPQRADTWFIYTLVDARQPELVRYVGVTNNPRRRFRRHMRDAETTRTHKALWIASAVRSGGSVLMAILSDGLSHADALSREADVIAKYRSFGFDLTNTTDGGDGVVGLVHSDAAKSAMSRARRGRKFSDEHREKLSASQKGRPGKPQSAETIAKRRASMLGKKFGPHSDETRAKISASKSGKPINRAATTASGFKGVYRDKKKWAARINVKGSVLRLGSFDTAEAAASAYDAAANDAHGVGNCYINFPKEAA